MNTSPPENLRPVRVLHLAAGNLFGGVERLLVTFAKLRNQNSQIAPSFATCFDGRLRNELRELGAVVHQLPEMRRRYPWSVWAARRKLTTLLTEQAIDLVLCHGAWPYALLAPAAHSKCVLWLHGTFRPNEWADRTAARLRPKLTIAVSHDVRRSATAHFASRVEVLHAPYSPKDAEVCRHTARVRSKIDPETVLITQVSRIESGKGHAVLLRALRELRKIPRWRCWIVGGPQRASELKLHNELQALAIAYGILDRVAFLGERTDVDEILNSSDIFCLPNVVPEGFSVAILEAMHARLPVVASNIGGTIEQVNESCGVLVDPGNATALAEVLTQLVLDNELRGRLGAAGPARVNELCSPQRQMNRLVELLASVN